MDQILQNYETEGQKPPNKLSTVLRGPHKIVGKYTRPEGPDVYTVQNLTTNKLEDFKVNDLRPFRFNHTRTNPQEVALNDKDLYIVKSVLRHQGSMAKRSSMTFNIEWKGYDEEPWEPWTYVRDKAILHKYLRDNKLSKLIPKRFYSGF